MVDFGQKNLRLLGLVLFFSVSFLLVGCGGSGILNNDFSITVYGFELNYNGKTKLERLKLKTDDLNEIIDLYQEIGDGGKYRDSLLIAEKYAGGVGANKFSQDNLNTLLSHGLTLSNIKKSQILLNKYGKKINAVLIDYEITKGLISDVPLLYVSQLFIPYDKDMILMSFISENESSRLSVSNMFKNIK